ncbi:MAG: CHAT domain-containing protein [Actinomycetota bacterium]|nr:CHAT domain-containing protein [Actinomycetota bacterium]
MPEEESFARRLVDRNARWAALAVSVAACRDQAGAALAAPGDPVAFVRAALATLELNRIAEELADPDCTELAANGLTACLRVASALPAVALEFEVIRHAVRDLQDAHRRIAALTLRHRATRAENAGRPREGRRLREQALPQAPAGSYLEAVLLIELERMSEAHRVLDRLDLPDPVVMAELNIRADRPDVARDILARAAETPPVDIRPTDDEHPAHRDPADRDPAAADAARQDPAWGDLARRAGIELDLGDAAAADKLAARAIAVFERGAMANDYYRALAGDHVAVAGLYHVASRARLALGDAGGAFRLADRVRAAAVQPGRNPAIRAAEARLGATHERLAAAALRGEQPTHAEVAAEAMAAETAVDQASAGSPVTWPPGAALEEIQAALAGNAALLYYQSFDRELITWVVRRDRAEWRSRKLSRRDLARAARELHTACADLTGRGERVPQLAARLAADLVTPVADELAGVDRLFVAPPGNLMLLPFAVLPLNRVPLGEQFVLSMLPSAELLTRRGTGRRPDDGRGALLVGDPLYATLPRLPGTGVEIRAIAERLPAAVVLEGEAATVEQFARHVGGKSVIHLATHGAVDELRPYLSELALSGRDRITLPDLAALDLDVDLLVLSACHTGRGRATAGGDVLGLTRVALAAGVRHVIVSLWPVDDISTCLLMTTLYERLAHGQSVAEALAGAARHLRAVDDKQRLAAYDGLAGASHVSRVRDLEAAETAVPAGHRLVPAHYAPFIHIGV